MTSGAAEPLHIALLAEYYLPRLGGIETFTQDLARALIRRGHHVRVITPTPADASDIGSGVPASEDPECGDFRVVRVPSLALPAVGVPCSPALPRRFRTAIAAAPTDVVHVQASVFSLGALAGGWAGRSLGLPIVTTFHSVLGKRAWLYRWTDAALGWGSWSTVLAGVSPAVSRGVADAIGREIQVLPNGVDVVWWRVQDGDLPEPDPRTLRVVTVHRLFARKRGLALLEIVAAAQKRRSSDRRIEITFVGDGPERGILMRRAAELELSARFLGSLARTDVRRELLRADVFALATDEDAFVVAAAEARAAGLPVLAFRTGAMPHLVVDGRGGILVESDRELEDAVGRLLDEPELLARLKSESLAVPPPYDWSQVVIKQEDAYRLAIELRKGRGSLVPSP